MEDLFYIPPSKELFDEIKRESIKLWNTYDDTYGYATKKIERIKDLENHSSNGIWMVQMFDIHNIHRLMKWLSPKWREFIASRLPDTAQILLFIHEE